MLFHFLYCSVLSLGGKVNKRRMSQPDMGSIFHIKKQWKILVIGETILLWIIKIIKIKCFHILLGHQRKTDTSILVYKYRPERTGFNMYAENTQAQSTFLALLPCPHLYTVDLRLQCTYTVTSSTLYTVHSVLEYTRTVSWYLISRYMNKNIYKILDQTKSLNRFGLVWCGLV